MLEGLSNNPRSVWHLKAVRPTNVMGANKRFCELILESRAALSDPVEGGCLYSRVRFGNVLGSFGSVVPLFRE